LKTLLRNLLLPAFAALFFLTAGAGALRAQAGLSEPGQEGAPAPSHINKITIKFIGMANVSEQIVRANMVLKEDTELDEALIDRDIRSLYRTGIFEFIEVKREQLSANQVNLVIEVTPKFRVLTVAYEGNKAVKWRRLAKEIKTVANGPLDERQIKEDAGKIYEYYQKRGFNQASVTYNIDRNRGTGFSTVTFKIREGARVKIAAVNFVGNDHVKARRLKKWRPRSGTCSPGSSATAGSRTTSSTRTSSSCATTTRSRATSTSRSPRTRSPSTTPRPTSS
jgi:outer membrane protein insertion porin family